MTDDQWKIFTEVAEQCKLQIDLPRGHFRRFSAINVASQKRSDAIVAAFEQLCTLFESVLCDTCELDGGCMFQPLTLECAKYRGEHL